VQRINCLVVDEQSFGGRAVELHIAGLQARPAVLAVSDDLETYPVALALPAWFCQSVLVGEDDGLDPIAELQLR
jgi:hypothetical protein